MPETLNAKLIAIANFVAVEHHHKAMRELAALRTEMSDVRVTSAWWLETFGERHVPLAGDFWLFCDADGRVELFAEAPCENAEHYGIWLDAPTVGVVIFLVEVLGEKGDEHGDGLTSRGREFGSGSGGGSGKD